MPTQAAEIDVHAWLATVCRERRDNKADALAAVRAEVAVVMLG